MLGVLGKGADALVDEEGGARDTCGTAAGHESDVARDLGLTKVRPFC
jgi:hypothetical protein